MSTPHKHHFIPAFYLRQWHGLGDKLVEYSIKRGKLIPKAVGAGGTGFQVDLYEFPDLPPNLAQFMEQRFFDYADRTASRALEMLLAGMPKSLWSSEMLSAWVRFLVGVHTRHPDTMPEIRAAAKAVWEGGAEQSQRIYETIKEPGDPDTFDDYIAANDPLIPQKEALKLVMGSIDNEIVGLHMMQMKWEVIDISASPRRFLTSDRPVALTFIKERRGCITMPISPTKLFVAVNDRQFLDPMRRKKPRDIVEAVNKDLVRRARRFVWATGKSQTQIDFIRKHMSKGLEPSPFFPTLARYTTSGADVTPHFS
jgi:Protein of unknown function (DUF4238)